MYKFILIFLVFSTIYLFIQITREKRRNRILQAFIAGVFDSVQKSLYAIETHDNEHKAKEEGYYEHFREVILGSVAAYLHADLWQKPYRKWLERDKNLFRDEKYANGGFNLLYMDLYKHELKETIKADKSAES